METERERLKLPTPPRPPADTQHLCKLSVIARRSATSCPPTSNNFRETRWPKLSGNGEQQTRKTSSAAPLLRLKRGQNGGGSVPAAGLHDHPWHMVASAAARGFWRRVHPNGSRCPGRGAGTNHTFDLLRSLVEQVLSLNVTTATVRNHLIQRRPNHKARHIRLMPSPRPWGPLPRPWGATIYLCYAIVLPSRQSGFWAGFPPESNRENLKIGLPAGLESGRNPAWKRDFRPGSNIA